MARQPERRRRDLSTEEIVATALDLAAREGSSQLTMRRLADACGVTPMALYHHVADKEELLTLLADRVVGEALLSTRADGSWQERLVDFACHYRRGFLANPAAAEVLLRRPVLSENLARCTEFMFQLFSEGGISGTAMAEATDAFVLLLHGSITNDLTRPPEVRRQLLDFAEPGELRLLEERMATYSHRDGEERFRLAAGWMLDGLTRG